MTAIHEGNVCNADDTYRKIFYNKIHYIIMFKIIIILTIIKNLSA